MFWCIRTRPHIVCFVLLYFWFAGKDSKECRSTDLQILLAMTLQRTTTMYNLKPLNLPHGIEKQTLSAIRYRLNF